MHVEQLSVVSPHMLMFDIVWLKTCKGQADMRHANVNPHVDTVYNISKTSWLYSLLISWVVLYLVCIAKPSTLTNLQKRHVTSQGYNTNMTYINWY